MSKPEGSFLRADELAPKDDDSMTVMLLKEILTKLGTMEQKASDIESQQIGIIEKQNDIEKKLKDFQKAFPNEDMAGHRAYHDSLIKWAGLRNEIVGEALKKSAQAGLLAGLAWLGYAIFLAIKMEFQK